MRTFLLFILWLFVAIIFSFGLAEEYPYTVHSGVALVACTWIMFMNHKQLKRERNKREWKEWRKDN